jgi:hypothetical protein
MANVKAVASGNWSDSATWDGGVLPTVNDDVFSNTFTVTIDGTFEVLSITNAAATGISAGGSFTFANGGDLTCTAGDGVKPAGATVLTFTLSSGNSATLRGNVVRTTTNNGILSMTCSGTGTLNIVGNLILTQSNFFSTALLSISANATINHIGNIEHNSNADTQAIVSVGSTCTYNHTGNVKGGDGFNNRVAIRNIGASQILTYNGTGNHIASAAPTIATSQASFINIVGNVTGQSGVECISITPSAGVVTTVAINGIITAGANRPAIVGILTTLVKVQGTVINQGTYNAIYAGQITLEGNIAYWQYRNALNNTSRNLYTVNNLNYPSATNVRNGITYGVSSELTGTAYIPSPANVLQGVPVDATVGTLLMTPADMWNYLTSSITTSGSIGKLVKDNLDAQVSSRLDSASYVAPNNSDITAIKAKTDNLPSDPASNTEVNQVASEVINELNTSSVDVAVRLRNSATVETTGNQIADLS